MSKTDSTDPNVLSFDQIVDEWKGANGGRIPIDSKIRIPMLMELFYALKQMGYENVFHNKIYWNKIANQCLNPSSPKLKKWRQCVLEDINTAVTQISPRVEWDTIRTMVPKAVLPIESENETASLAKEKNTDDTENEGYDPFFGKGKPLDRTKLGKIPEPEIMLNIDFLKKIGEIKDE